MAHYMSNKHLEVEKEFKDLPPAHQKTTVYIALCRVAKIRETAVEARLSVLDLFGKKAEAKKPEGDKDKKGDKDKREPEPEKPASKDEQERVARERNERRRAWESDFEDVDKREAK